MTDKANMWKKLSTPYDPDMERWRKRFYAGLKKGEMNIVMAKSKCGKSVYMDIESD